MSPLTDPEDPLANHLNEAAAVDNTAGAHLISTQIKLSKRSSNQNKGGPGA